MIEPKPLLEELDALWRVRYGEGLPLIAEPATIVRVMRRVEEKRLEEAALAAA